MPAAVMVWGCVSVHSMVNLYICEGTIMLKGTCRFWRNMLLSDDISFRDLPAYNGRTHSASVTAAWLCSKRVYVLD